MGKHRRVCSRISLVIKLGRVESLDRQDVADGVIRVGGGVALLVDDSDQAGQVVVEVEDRRLRSLGGAVVRTYQQQQDAERPEKAH